MIASGDDLNRSPSSVTDAQQIFDVLATAEDICWLTFKLARWDTYSSINMKVPGWASQSTAFCTLSALFNLCCCGYLTWWAPKSASAANVPTPVLQNSRYSEGAWGRTGVPVSESQHQEIQIHNAVFPHSRPALRVSTGRQWPRDPRASTHEHPSLSKFSVGLAPLKPSTWKPWLWCEKRSFPSQTLASPNQYSGQLYH